MLDKGSGRAQSHSVMRNHTDTSTTFHASSVPSVTATEFSSFTSLCASFPAGEYGYNEVKIYFRTPEDARIYANRILGALSEMR